MNTETILAELTALREHVTGVTNSAVASVDGLLIAHDASDVRPEVLAAMAAVALGLGKSTGAEVGMGELREVITRCEGGHIVVYAVRETSLLVVLGDEGLDMNRLHLHSRPAVTRIGELLAA
ncbi:MULTISPECIES: roadblock/LC7 domain-containing protein [unclassified Pseudofrankia]|uniref:roadblock/LC7 domain-containing protein n=1 Tax=unclassified Pseudofrankia TaxID=2994372 RepID=UPI0008DA74E3|nr:MULTISPECIES: roadblock/LC7 domain-containing protein [unclassified Pseudofrankia]MDT3443671.1 roadblock/LC7 domain-containing protein [Pseudofrankia sp. BMG5.37]OHV42929.1 dynein regulation protein LC7 [Pseudofrankia sp. BMG5.36]